MFTDVLLIAFSTLHLCAGWELLGPSGEREKVQTVCVGKEFRLPVDSTSRIVTFTPDGDGVRRVLLEKTTVKDPRFEWTRDKTLVLKEATHSDQGVYANKLSHLFTYETVHLIVSECIRPYRKSYGETFEHGIPENASLLEFYPRGAPPEAMPIVLWNRTNPETSDAGRGRLLRGGRVWLAEKVTQADQGNYTIKDDGGNVLSRSTLSVRGHSFNISRFTKESLTLPLFLPLHHAHLIFTPSRIPDESSLGPFDPKPPRGPVQLLREGHITDHDLRYRGIVSLSRNGSIHEVVIIRLTSRHDGLYEVRDGDGNLVSSTYLHMIEKRGGTWRALFKSISVPSGMFVSLAGFILFMKRYPNCSLSQIITGIRTNRAAPSNPPRVNIQNYSQTLQQPPAYYSHPEHPVTPRKWTPRASPAHSGYTPVLMETVGDENQELQRLTAGSSPRHNVTTEQEKPTEEEENISFSVPGASDCLHSCEDCVQFQIKKDRDEERWSKSNNFFSALPLDTDTSESCSVYTSNKLDFL
uniref:Ig-like domain-containing protein n=1 Tax=Nothobranchius kadleci TaxID=1051664 RepID=A0A1A8BF00_NOTKA